MKEKTQIFFKEHIAGNLVEKKYKILMSDETKERIENIKKTMEENKGLNFIIYFNHISFADPLLAGHIATLIDPNNTRKLIAPVSYSHTELKAKNSGTWGMKKIIEICGVETHRVVQAYQINDSNKEESFRINKKYLNRLRELKKLEMPVCLLISPEGHRSEGALEKGEEGVALSGKILAPTAYIPIGIIYNETYNRSSLNFGKKLTLSVGEMYIQEIGKKREEIFSILMNNLANALPVEMRGVYSNNIADIPEIRK